MKFCKIENNTVVQTQRGAAIGFIECPESVSCGMVKSNGAYKNPDLTPEQQLIIDKQARKKARDDALVNLAHDFLDGRIMQTRSKDESNIRNAIEIMTAQSIASIDWVMLDNKKYPVTVAELQTALLAGQSGALAIWGAYNP